MTNFIALQRETKAQNSWGITQYAFTINQLPLHERHDMIMVVPFAFPGEKGGNNMAVVSTPQAGRLTINVSEVVSGKEVTHARNFAGLKAGASDQDVFDVGSALAGLQKMTVVGITRTSAADLANE